MKNSGAVAAFQDLIAEEQPRKARRSSLAWDALRRLSRNRAAVIGGIIVIVNILVAIFGPMIVPKKYDKASLINANATPRWVTQVFTSMKPKDAGGYVKINNNYLLGADKLGHDLLSRVVYGGRISLAVAFVGPFTSIVIGLIVGLIAGYKGGRTDELLMRFVDIMYAFPTMLLIILLMSVFRAGFAGESSNRIIQALSKVDASMGGLFFIFIGIGLTAWMGAARLVRGQVLLTRELEYVEAARALGGSTFRVILGHVLPNVIGPLIITETLGIPGYISYEAFLSFIGLGVNPPTPSWGGMIAEGANSIQNYPNQAIFPALALFLLMFAFNYLGDGLRDALDPTMRGKDLVK